MADRGIAAIVSGTYPLPGQRSAASSSAGPSKEEQRRRLKLRAAPGGWQAIKGGPSTDSSAVRKSLPVGAGPVGKRGVPLPQGDAARSGRPSRNGDVGRAVKCARLDRPACDTFLVSRREIAVAVAVAIITAAATLGGVLLTGCQEKRADERALDRQHERELRTATRLMQDEITTVDVHLNLLLQRQIGDLRHARFASHEFLPNQVWNQYKAVIAASGDVSDAQWDKLSDFYSNIRGLKRQLLVQNPRRPLPPGFLENMPTLEREAKQLIGQLKRLTPD